VIDSIVSAEDDQVQLQEFMPSTDKDIGEMFTRLKTIVAQVKNPHLAGLIKAFLDDTELMDKLCTAPAAIVLHHAYIGGLLEHTLAVLELAQKVLPLYPQLDADLILTGIFLHDIGKTTELQYQISFQYSNQGHLLGHLVKGTLLIEEKIRQLNSANTDAFPQLLADCLMHIIVAHHGQREFGCPVLPSTPEAFFVHYLDNLDSKMALTLAEITKDTNKTDWTNYVKSIEAPLFKHHNVSNL
jgi:3'-5' exoribonuclease